MTGYTDPFSLDFIYVRTGRLRSVSEPAGDRRKGAKRKVGVNTVSFRCEAAHRRSAGYSVFFCRMRNVPERSAEMPRSALLR